MLRHLLAFAVAACSHARQPRVADTGDVAIQCGALIDGISAQPIPHTTIVVRSGRIAEVVPGFIAPADMRVVDLRADTCLPGLIDMHTHLTDVPEDSADLRRFFRDPPGRRAELARRNAEATLWAGFTTVRNVGTYIAWADRELRDGIDRGEIAGPRMQICGFYLTIPHGGGDLFVPGHPEPNAANPKFHAGVARGAAQFRERAARAIAGGADVVKVIASGAVLAFGGVPAQSEMTVEELAAVVEVAHAASRKVAAHAHGGQSIKDAIGAGVDTIEHASLIDDEGIALAHEHRVALVMDIYNGDYIDTEGRAHHVPAEFLRKNLETTQAQREAFRRAHAAGVPLVFGTDAAVFPHGNNARQFRVMTEHGMTAREAIASATSLAADYLGWGDRVGRIAPGRFGDVIAVTGDPLADITLLEHVAVVIKGGVVVRR